MAAIGVMPMPTDFRYRDVFLKGKPWHDGNDPFLIRHPRMDRGHRAKIFSPFDALKGFGEAVSSKDVLYRDRVVPGQEVSEEISRRLQILRRLTRNSRMARENRVRVSVTWYEPCSDENSEAYGTRGLYRTATGICRNVDSEVTKTILVDDLRIPLDDVCGIEIVQGNAERGRIHDCGGNQEEAL